MFEIVSIRRIDHCGIIKRVVESASLSVGEWNLNFGECCNREVRKVEFNLPYFKLSSLLQDLHRLVEFILSYTCFVQDRLLSVQGWKSTQRLE